MRTKNITFNVCAFHLSIIFLKSGIKGKQTIYLPALYKTELIKIILMYSYLKGLSEEHTKYNAHKIHTYYITMHYAVHSIKEYQSNVALTRWACKAIGG